MSKSSLDVVCFGEMLIDFVPDVAGVSLAESTGFVKDPGGAPANVACAVTKLGGSSAFIGKFGDDEFGHMLVDVLKKNELSFVTLKKDGEREFMFYRNPSADMMLKVSDLNKGLIQQAKIFHYGSISLITEPCRLAHMAAMKAAREAGALLSYDPNVRLPLWPSSEACREGIKSIWTSEDIINVSDEEVEFLTQGDASDEKNVLSLWFDGLKLLLHSSFIAHFGLVGCKYFTKNFNLTVEGFSVNTVDTTGAGDAIIGSFLYSAARGSSVLENELKLKNALQLANACGAICTTAKGAIPALPDHAAAQNLILDRT
ncbi:hypothetical protein MKX03_007815 [Papaver bracteatum]|nr:hypothetical protein MKX03_007815 [Papaver bracteatum]